MIKKGQQYDIYITRGEVLEGGMTYNGINRGMHEFAKPVNKRETRVVRMQGILEGERGEIIIDGGWGFMTKKGERD